jgi:hypothetical protein
MASAMISPFLMSIFQGMYVFFIAFVARALFRRPWLTGLVVWAALVMFLFGALDRAEWRFFSMMLTMGIPLTLRFGLFFLVVWGCLGIFVDRSLLTTDFGAWYGQSSLIAVIVIGAVALWAFRTSLGGRPLLALAPDVRS